MSVCPSICLKLKILVTTEPIGYYSLGNMLTSPVVVFIYGVGTPPTTQKRINIHPSPPKKSAREKNPTPNFYNKLQTNNSI